MHHCLEIPNIVEHIATCLKLAPDGARKEWLLNLGLACCALYDPAMNVLWRELDDFLPLLFCIPGGLVTDDVQRCWSGACWNLRVRHALLFRPLASALLA